MSKGYPLTDCGLSAVHSSCRVFAAILPWVESSAKAASTVAQPMALRDRSASVAASRSMREPSGRACWQPASRPHQAGSPQAWSLQAWSLQAWSLQSRSFQRRRSCVRRLAQRTTPTVAMPTMAAMTIAMMMMTATMRTVAAPDLSRPHCCCRYRLAVRPLDPPRYPHSRAATNYRPLNPKWWQRF